MKVGRKEILRVIRVDKEKGKYQQIKVTSISPRNKSTLTTKTKVKPNMPTQLNFTLFSFILLNHVRYPFWICTKNTFGASTKMINKNILLLYSNNLSCFYLSS